MGEIDNHIETELAPDQVIILPNDPDLVARLTKKLAEYGKRVQDRTRAIPMESSRLAYIAPEDLDGNDVKIPFYILTDLLRDGRVSINDYRTRFPEQKDYDLVTNAFNVIKSYALHNGEGNVGGTGLPDKD